MKSFLTALLIAAVLIAGSIVYTQRLEACSRTLNEMTDSIAGELNKENYDAAMANINRLSSELNAVKPFIAAFGNHSDIDLIETNLAELEVYAANRQKYDAQSKARVISVLFEHLPKNTHVWIENIL